MISKPTKEFKEVKMRGPEILGVIPAHRPGGRKENIYVLKTFRSEFDQINGWQDVASRKEYRTKNNLEVTLIGDKLQTEDGELLLLEIE